MFLPLLCDKSGVLTESIDFDLFFGSKNGTWPTGSHIKPCPGSSHLVPVLFVCWAQVTGSSLSRLLPKMSSLWPLQTVGRGQRRDMLKVFSSLHSTERVKELISLLGNVQPDSITLPWICSWEGLPGLPEEKA